ncbi:MAG: RNA-binding protein [archaeon]
MNEELKQHILKALEKNIRYDGRKKDELRKITISKNFTSTAEGSAQVKFGDTEVLVGVKMSIEKPYADRPDDGMLMVNAELLPLSNPAFESGPPDVTSIEIARVIDRGIREGHAFDTKTLCLTPGEKVWSVSVDICPINSDGNLLDVGAFAAIIAIQSTRYPHYENDKIDYEKKTDKQLALDKVPIAITVIKIGSHLLVDPIEDEERVLDARLTMTFLNEGELCSLQKGGDSPLTIDEITQMVELGKTKSLELRKLL